MVTTRITAGDVIVIATVAIVAAFLIDTAFALVLATTAIASIVVVVGSHRSWLRNWIRLILIFHNSDLISDRHNWNLRLLLTLLNRTILPPLIHIRRITPRPSNFRVILFIIPTIIVIWPWSFWYPESVVDW